ncbi:thioredoxin domain-containing protein [Candidatus Microgenomates bacterium]|nr:thioredoxin domain-containing protein [Candidatus Microgenomates bacterium]
MELTAKNIGIAVVALVVIFAALFGVYALTNTPTQTTATDVPEARTLRPSDHLTWSKDKKVILTEYADLQCPACRNFHDIFKQMEGSKADQDIVSKVTLVYRHYPLQTVHKNALNAAFTAEAAGLQGKFFQAVSALYDAQETWEPQNNPQFGDYLKSLKLDTEKLKADTASKKVKDAVSEDIASGNRVGISATPTFFLNGRQMEIASIEDFKKQLRTAASAK